MTRKNENKIHTALAMLAAAAEVLSDTETSLSVRDRAEFIAVAVDKFPQFAGSLRQGMPLGTLLHPGDTDDWNYAYFDNL